MNGKFEKIALAKKFRLKGRSFNEIAIKLQIAKSTVYEWTSDIKLGRNALKRLANKKNVTRNKALSVMKTIRDKKKRIIEKKAQETISKSHLDQATKKILCSVLFRAEGEKSQKSHMAFINSEPEMISLFLHLLRTSFALDEKKFRVLVHIHEYHDEKEIKLYWSHITKISLSQFTKSYRKPNTNKRSKENYKGTISIRYYDYKIALELHFIYNNLIKKLVR